MHCDNDAIYLCNGHVIILLYYYFIWVKTLISNLVRTTRFWNNLHRVLSISKYWKTK